MTILKGTRRRRTKMNITFFLENERYPGLPTLRDFSIEVQNSENDPYFSRFLYGVSKFSDFLRISQFFDFFLTFFIIIGNHRMLRSWNSWTANSDKKYMELNGAAFTFANKKQRINCCKQANGEYSFK